MSDVQTVVLLENSPTPAYLIEETNVVYTEGMSGAQSAAVAQAAAANADADAAAAHTDRLAADADVVATVAAKLQAIAAKNSAETAASSAGTDLAAILAAIGGSTWAGALTIQVASRTALGALSGMTAGTQVYLSERGYEGPFEFVAGDQSAQITADTYHALWVAPTAASSGSSGAWRRIHYGLAQASWAGVIATGIGNYAAQINSLLAHVDVWAVELPSGTIGVTGPILVTSGKLLFGKGINSTILKATATTGYTAGAAIFQNAIVNLVSGSVGSRARDFTVDGNKLGSHTIGGVHQIQSKQAVVERIYAKNCSAYAFWAVTNFVYTLDATSGVFRNCWAENCNVGFETTAAQNILFDRCHARDGDADISPSIETMFHPITGSKKVTYRDCTGISSIAGTIVHCATYTAEPVEDISFEGHCWFQHLADGVCVSLDAYSAAIRRVRFGDELYIESADYFGINSTDSGPYGLDFSVGSCMIKALAQGIVNASVIGNLEVRGTKIIMRHISADGEVGPVVTAAGCDLVLDGPIFDTDRVFAYPQSFPQNAMIASPPVVMVPMSHPPMGIGDKVVRVLTADENHNGGAALVGTGPSAFNVTVVGEGTYAAHVQGAYSSGALTNSIALQVESNASAVHGSGEIHGHADGSLVKHGKFEGATSAFGSGDGVSAINTPFPFSADFTVYFDSDGGNFSFNIGPYVNDGVGFGGTSSIKTRTMMTIERIA